MGEKSRPFSLRQVPSFRFSLWRDGLLSVGNGKVVCLDLSKKWVDFDSFSGHVENFD